MRQNKELIKATASLTPFGDKMISISCKSCKNNWKISKNTWKGTWCPYCKTSKHLIIDKVEKNEKQ